MASANEDMTPFERRMARVPDEALLRSPSFDLEPPRTMRTKGLDWEYELRVALPASYRHTDERYPVLWITDNNLETALAVLASLDLILVGVGSGRVSVHEHARRRVYDLKPAGSYFFDGPGGDHLRRLMEEQPYGFELRGGGADRFLDFLVSEARPALAADYRMNADDHVLLGFSAGGTFVCNALLTRPEAFARYICGSPSLYSGNFRVFELEEEYAATHDDLPARVFFASGEAELTEPMINALGMVSGMARLVERLSFRGYPSLRLEARVLPGESHATMLAPLIGRGVRSVWDEDELRPNA
jgi:predicted alpha/beta superfamily hydrolase